MHLGLAALVRLTDVSQSLGDGGVTWLQSICGVKVMQSFVWLLERHVCLGVFEQNVRAFACSTYVCMSLPNE